MTDTDRTDTDTTDTDTDTTDTDRTDTELADTSGDIAIVGMAGRFPGARDVAEFWRNLVGGVESITEFTEEELVAAGVPAADVADPLYVRSAPVLDGVDMFDAGFFGLTPKEAQVTDPQQRLFLEVAWEAFEDAGYDPGRLADSVGVFAGSAISTYLLNNLAGNPAVAGSASVLQLALGNDKDSLATRVAYALDLRGPSFSVQSYCSTSLVAVATACTSLLSGDCDLALAGGVAISVPHRVGYLYQDGGISSPDGHCRAFDADAAGAPIGNGAAAVVLRRFDDAVEAGDHVYAVLKGWAVNNDGSLKAGYPAPGVRGQTRVIVEAMANADVRPQDIDYIEAHGTGTSLGDAAEFAALTNAFEGSSDAVSSGHCAIGSLKTNVGHLDRAAGVTGLIKTALSLRNRTLVPTLHFTRPNPRLDFAHSPFHVQTSLQAWPDPGRPRLAGVSSFGIGGTNAHVVVQQAPAPSSADSTDEQVIVLSGRCTDSADARVRDLAEHLQQHPEHSLADVAHTLQAGRRHFPCRRAVVVAHSQGAITALTEGTVLRHDGTVIDRGVEFEFGEHLPASSVTGLYHRWPSFAEAVDRCGAALAPEVGQRVRLALSAGTAGAPADLVTFVAQYALAELVAARSVRPTRCHGSGVGADVAAVLSGTTALADALRGTATRTPTSPSPSPHDGADVRLVFGTCAPTDRDTVRLFADPAMAASSAVLTALAELWVAGASVDWTAEHDGDRYRVSLPTYPFQRRRYWIEPATTTPPATVRTPEPVMRRPMAEWRHVPVWRPTDTAPGEPVGPYIVFADGLGIGDRLAEVLAPDAPCVTVVPGDAFTPLGPDRYAIRPDHAADYAALFERLSSDGVVPHTVAHLWSVGPVTAGLSADAVRADQVTGFTSVLHLVRCLGPAGVGGVRLLLGTSGSCVVDGSESPAPGRATLAGLALAIPQEHPGIGCRLVDLQTTDPDQRAGELLGELAWPGSDTTVAFRAGQRYTRRFERDDAPSPAPAPIVRDGGVYLLTGGLGSIGLLVAGYLAERTSSCEIVLVGRHGLPPRAEWDSLPTGPAAGPVAARVRQIAALERAGARITVETVDVADPRAVGDLVTRTVRRFGRLDGVVHSAGRTATDGFTSIEKLGADLVEEHFAPKVHGTLSLAAALGDRELDFCVLQSSISSVLGGLGFAAYSAANAFLDAFVPAHNLGTGAGWQVVDWDTWEHVAEDLRRVDVGTSMSSFSMSSDEGLRTLERIVLGGAERTVVSTGDLDRRLAQWAPGTDPLATAGSATVAAPVDRFPRPNLIEVCVPPSTPVEHRLVALWQDVLGLDEVGVHDNFFQLGGNSLIVLQLVARMQKDLGRPIEATAVLAAPTVSALIEQLGLADHAVTEEAPVTVDRPSTETTPDIAIIGMAGRFPGASTTDQFWRNLRDGVESVTRFTDAELLDAGVSGEVSRRPDYLPFRPVLDGVEDFDPEFFGDTVEQARLVDPQHRIFQECAWEALENAGYVGQTHTGSIGVFGGSNFGTYLHRLLADPVLGPSVDERTVAMGNDKDGLATSVSFKLDLRGPSVSVQSFCSTSLVAVHLACRSLRDGECDMAIAGGVSVRVPDRVGQFGDPGHDGHVRCFDADGHGLLKGDGAATVVLKRLSDAVADGDTIAAVIKGSAVNNDGAMKGGYDAPSVAGQAEVVAAALRDADVAPETISYVEAHGGSSLIGDQIEVAALTSAFGASATGAPWCALGSAKSNVGHLEHASGVTGLIKTALSLRHRTLPPMLHFTRPNPGIDFERSPFHVNTSLRAWVPEDGAVRRAGVSSLGLGGTNAHVIVEEAGPSAPGSPGRRHQVLPVSARSAPALRAAIARLADHLRTDRDASLADVAYTLQVGRAAFEYRAAVVCETVADAVRLLDDHVVTDTACVPGRPAGFLFDGAVPAVDEPEFAAAVQACGEAAGDSESTELPTFAGQYALATLLRAWGVRPRTLAGVGVGALVAACLSGELSLAQAVERLDRPARPVAEPPSPGRSALVVCGLATAPHAGDVVVPTVTADGDVERSLAVALGVLWTSGVPVGWDAYHGTERRRRTPLPTYPFQRRRCWFGPDPVVTEPSLSTTSGTV
jgi:acyl transferase domain-containing protein